MDDIDTNNNNIGHNIQAPINYNANELIEVSKRLLEEYISINDHATLSATIRNYINNIKGFYNSNDKNTLQQLTNIVDRVMNHGQSNFRTYMRKNIKELYDYNIITRDECEELLKFNLFLNIMTNIHNSEKRAYLKRSVVPIIGYTEQITIYGKKYWIPKEEINGRPYVELLQDNTQRIIKQLSEILIKKYFILDRPSTWVAKDELIRKIKNAIEDICNYFDNLQISNETLDNIPFRRKTFDNIPCDVDPIIEFDVIDNFVYDSLVQQTLVRKLEEEFGCAQVNKMRKGINIKSKYVMESKIGGYLSPNLLNRLARHTAFPAGLFSDPHGIPYIVLSYFKDDLAYDWRNVSNLFPDYIIRYIKRYNVCTINEEFVKQLIHHN